MTRLIVNRFDPPVSIKCRCNLQSPLFSVEKLVGKFLEIAHKKSELAFVKTARTFLVLVAELAHLRKGYMRRLNLGDLV